MDSDREACMLRRDLRILALVGILGCVPLCAQDIHIQSSKGFVTVLRGDPANPVIRSKDSVLVTDDRIVSGPDAEAQVFVDPALSLEVGPESEVRFDEVYPGRYQMELLKGGVTWNVLQPSSADAEMVTPSVS